MAFKKVHKTFQRSIRSGCRSERKLLGMDFAILVVCPDTTKSSMNPICHQRYAAKRVAAKDDESVIRFRNSRKFREIKWKILKHDRLDEKICGGWLVFESVMEL
ncbi:MAG: hypothetical protein VX003_05260, partial [SAR324 cluster bacterium]|nr:hypothetical protein [SAR324 cluster bacterium]